MERLGPGDGTFSHLSQTSHYMTAPLDTVLRDAEVLPNNGPTAFSMSLERGWKRSSPSLQTTNGQSLAQQHNKESDLGRSTVPVHRLIGENEGHDFTAVLPRQNDPLHKLQQWNSGKNGGSSNNLYNQQQHLKITKNSPKDSVQQVSFAHDHFGVISAQAQMINLRQQNVCVAKDVFQQKYVSPKAIAVVTPLTPKEVVGVSFAVDMSKVKERGLESKSVPNKKDCQPFVPHTFQATTNKNGAKESTLQTRELPSDSALATGFSHCVKDDGLDANTNPPGSSPTVSVPLNSESVYSREVVQPYPTNSNCSAKPLHENDSTVINPVGTKMDARMDTLSTIAVQEWSLQRLQAFMIDLEQTEQKQQKDLPFDDLASEILKMYWNGDYKKLCNAAKTNFYIDIMKEVRLYCGTKNSVILQEVSKERLNEIASNIQILKHCIAPPKMVHTSSWLNLSKKHFDTDKEQNDPSSLMTLPCKKTNIAAKQVPVKEMENLQKPTNEEMKASNKALSGEEEQGKPLPQVHQKSVTGDKLVRTESEDINVKNISSGEEKGGQGSMTVKNVIIKGVSESEKQNTTKCESEAPLLKSSNTQSSDVHDCQKKTKKLIEKLLTTDTAPMLDKNGFADGTSVEMSILSPERAGDPGVKVDNMQKDAQIVPDSMGQVTAQLLDQDKKHMDTGMKSDERSSGIKINWELENYCCLAKWFQVLGYRNGGLCKCEKIDELSHHADTSGNNVKEVDLDKNMFSFNKACKLTGTNICALRDNKHATNSLRNKSMIGQKSDTLPDADDASMNELEIVDVVTNYEDVLKMANAMSEQLMEAPLIAHESHKSTSDRNLCHKKVTTAKFKTGETLINLALFGSSQLRQRKYSSEFTSSDKVQLPPETINVRIDSGWNEYPKSTKSQTKKQVWNSWKKTYVPSNMFTNSKSKKRQMSKHAKALESKNDAANNPVLKSSDLITDRSEAKCENTFSLASTDKQKDTNTIKSKRRPRKQISLPRQDQSKKLKRGKKSSLLNLKKRWNNAHHGNTFKKSFDSAPIITTSKRKLNTGLALNFGVLPESFNISEGSSTIEANQLANTDGGSKVKTVMQTKRRWGTSGTWCENPRKKQCLKPTCTPPNTSGISTFQEFKKKYEEKKQRIPT